MIELELPWPDRALHPNARVHWRPKAQKTRRARDDGYWIAAAFLAAKRWNGKAFDIPEGKLAFHVDFYPPDRRKRDDDGLLTCVKPARDGIAEALGIDDNRFVSHPRVMDEVVKGGMVRVRIVPVES